MYNAAIMNDLLALVNKAKNGDRKAFGRIYKLYYERIYRFVFYLISDDQMACDITQNTFIKMWNRLPKFKTENGTIQAYLFTIARNQVIDYRRKKKEYSLDLALNMSQDDNLIDKIAKSESKQKLEKVLKEIEDDERQLLILRYFEDLSMVEIAKIVKKEEGAVRVRIHRILKKLKQIFIRNYAN